jgi:hypothetical protein
MTTLARSVRICRWWNMLAKAIAVYRFHQHFDHHGQRRTGADKG